jgi:putative transposase
MAESVIGLYKTECVRVDGPFRTVDDLELATCSWVHWFNHTRLHGAIGHVPPVEHEAAHYRHHNSRQPTLPG